MFKGNLSTSKRQTLSDKQIEALQMDKFSGMLSVRTQKKIIQIAQNWRDTLDLINEKNNIRKGKNLRTIILLTLTLPSRQMHSDKEIKRFILIPFIQKLTYHFNSLNYLWKAEPQKNGNIHFHILIDKFIDKDFVRELWNKSCHAQGYTGFDDKKYDKFGAPSTRIEGLREKYNAISYIASYITKNEGSRLINGRLWGCNNELRELKPIESKMNKEGVLEIVEHIARSSNDIICSEHYCLIKNVPDKELIPYIANTSYLFNNNLTHNIAALSNSVLSPNEVIKTTDWYKDIVSEFGELHASYLENNGMLFGLQEYEPAGMYK